ncbi:MAG: hypothetical protein EZS28_054646, partial [Streblomastix strix]
MISSAQKAFGQFIFNSSLEGDSNDIDDGLSLFGKSNIELCDHLDRLKKQGTKLTQQTKARLSALSPFQTHVILPSAFIEAEIVGRTNPISNGYIDSILTKAAKNSSELIENEGTNTGMNQQQETEQKLQGGNRSGLKKNYNINYNTVNSPSEATTPKGITTKTIYYTDNV